MNHSLAQYNLQLLISELVKRYPVVNSVYLFGSRNHKTQSVRSDVDLIIQHTDFIRPAELRNLAEELCPALDLFLCRDNIAISCANESYIEAATFNKLIEKISATKLWAALDGFNQLFNEWYFSVPVGAEFAPTAVLLSVEDYNVWAPRVRDFLRGIEQSGFPPRPFIGSTSFDVADTIVSAVRDAVKLLSNLEPRGKNTKLELHNEYDFQNLFFLIVKSWFPNLAREQMTVHYDGQDKIADFNFLNNRLIFELKHIRTNGGNNNKALTLKTIAGLTDFYIRNSNVAILVNILLVDKNIGLDDRKIEEDYSFKSQSPEVWTVVVRNSK